MTFNDLRDACAVAYELDQAGMTGPANEVRAEIVIASKRLLSGEQAETAKPVFPSVQVGG